MQASQSTATAPSRKGCSAIRHRGPDEDGILIEGPVGLAHRRLSIIDLSGGHQPVFNEDRSAWIVFNGEIYNFREIRVKLERDGVASAQPAITQCSERHSICRHTDGSRFSVVSNSIARNAGTTCAIPLTKTGPGKLTLGLSPYFDPNICFC